MIASLIFSLIVVLGADLPGSRSCGQVVDDLQDILSHSVFAMEPESSFGAIFQQANAAKDRCPDSEPIAYLLVRSAELGMGAAIGRQPESSIARWRTMAAEAAKRFPRSARIATVEARASESVDDARRAVSLDPSYLPAQVALSAALVGHDPAEAVKVVVAVKDLGAVSGGHTVAARARLAARDVAGAKKEAMLALHSKASSLIEPDGRDPRPISGAHEVLGVVFLEEGDFRKAAMHLQMAAQDSKKAREILKKPPKQLARFLRGSSERKDSHR